MTQNILKIFKSAIKSAKLDGFVIPSTDEFQNEYVPEYLNRLGYITGFTGSNGVAIITLKTCAFFTDGRYLLQAREQLGVEYAVLDIAEKASCDWFDLGLKKGSIIGYDPMLHSKDNLAYYERLGAKYGFIMKPCTNLVDTIWKRDAGPIKPAFKLALKYAGLSYEAKCKQVFLKLAIKADGLLITNSDAICWLLNIRGADISYTPFLLSFAILMRDGTLQLFTDPRKVKFNLPKVTVHPISDLIKTIKSTKQNLQVDPAKTPVKFLQALKKKAIHAADPIELLKACKNLSEIQGIKQAHEADGLALTKFLCWLSTSGMVTEIEAGDKLLEYRQQSELFVYPSFATISAYGANAAIIHYNASKESNSKIGKDNFYLLDSGGQYHCGTTDVTRTLHLGNPTKEQKRLFTLVLKGHINLAMAKFPKGTTGAHLDTLARMPLWQEGLDFAHGTGHGVGHFLAVHEGPQRISQSLRNAVPLEAGMVVSNEPGFYENGVLGIRIENLLLVKESADKGFLEFETLTLAPIQHNLIDYNMLDLSHINWIKTYNGKVLYTFQPNLSKAELDWLAKYIS